MFCALIVVELHAVGQGAYMCTLQYLTAIFFATKDQL